jgi:low temperature requirement protein LtrA
VTKPSTEPAVRVSTLELFFDLVFVFTLTQFTRFIADDTSAERALQLLVMFGVLWWMYGGYAWLTNVVAPTSWLRRGLLLVGMAGYLMIALAIPDAYADAGWAFGVGYFIVNAVHSGLFLYSAGAGASRAMLPLASTNLVAATLVLAGGVLPERWRLPLWALVLVLQWTSPYLHPKQEWSLSASHFVERHGLVVIVALGESIVAIGVGAAGLPVDADLVLVAGFGLALAFLLWWAYFGGDDEAAEHQLARIPPLQRGRAALYSFGHAHLVLLLGIVVLAAGVKKAIGHAFEHLPLAHALALGGGLAVFLLGDVWFRRVLSIGRLRYRTLAAVAALATVPIGQWLATAQLAALVVVLLATLAAESRVSAAPERAEPSGRAS